MMTLLDLGSSGLSLEFAPAEWLVILAELERMAGEDGVRRDPRSTYDLVRVGASEFVLTDEWEEPCLLAREAGGGVLLRDLFDRLGGGKVGLA